MNITQANWIFSYCEYEVWEYSLNNLSRAFWEGRVSNLRFVVKLRFWMKCEYHAFQIFAR